MENNTPEFIVSLGNCGTSDKTFFGTLDDCIVIKFNNTNFKVSLKFLKNATNDVEVRFFDNMKTNVYTKKSILKNDIMVCNENYTLLLCIVNYLVTGNTGFDINHHPELTAMVEEKIPQLVKSINSFFDSNPKLKRWRDIFEVYAEAYNSSLDSGSTQHTTTTASQLALPPLPPPPLESTALQLEPLPNTTASMTPLQQQTDTTASQLAPLSDGPNLNYNESSYIPIRTTSGIQYYKKNLDGTPNYKELYVQKKTTSGTQYYKKNPDGTIDYSTFLTTPPVGGNRKRYRTSRKYRKQQSRKKSRRHFQRRKKTHRHKSRKSRK